MKSMEEFQGYYESQMRPELDALESRRRKAQPRFWAHLRWWLGAWVLMCVGGFVTGMTPEQVFNDLGIAHGVFFAGVFLIPLWRLIHAAVLLDPITKACKQDVIVPMVRWLAPEVAYEPHGVVDLAQAKKSQLIREHDSLEGEDHFRGRIGQTELEFGELVVHYHTIERDSKGRRRKVHHEEHGFFLIATGNKSLTGVTHVLPDHIEGVLGSTAAKALTVTFRDDLHAIHLEDVAFEKLFAVYCSDDVEAHYILTPSLMARLTEYREHHGRDVRLSFEGKRLYAYFPPPLDRTSAMFDVSGFSNLLDFDTFRPIYEELAMMLGIVEELNLNTRIWGEIRPDSG